MTSKIVVNNIEADSGINTITFINEVTAPTFNGNIVGTAATFSGNVDIAGALTYEDVTNVDSVGIVTARSGIHVTGGLVGIGTNIPNAPLHVEKDGTSQVLARFESNMGTNNNRSISINSPTSDSASEPFIFNTGNAYQFQTDDQVGLHINSNRSIGIGTDNPSQKLNVFNGSASDTGGVLVQNVTYASSQDKPYLVVGTKSWTGATTNWNTYGFQHRVKSNSGGTPRITVDTHTGEKFCIDNGGKVGIGTGDPDSKLTVAADSATAQIEIKRTNTNASGTVGVINFTALDGHSVANISAVGDGDDEGAHLVFRTTSAAGENSPFGGSTIERLRVTSAGDVGINTSSPSYKLHVNGSFAATTKSFVIDHPTKEGMKLRYGSLEGPENGVYVRGRLKDNNTIELPDYWTGLVDEETITVNLTPIGRKAPLHSVVDIAENTVIVESANDAIDCFYTVFGERKDVEKLEVEF